MKHVHYVPMGPFPYFVGFTTSPEAFRREAKRLKCDVDAFTLNAWSDAATHFLRRQSGGTTTIICMAKPGRKLMKEQFAALLAHEAVHVVQHMRETIGELGLEPEAYIVQRIVQDGLLQAYGSTMRVNDKPTP